MPDYSCRLHLPRSMSRRDILRAALASAGMIALGPFGRRSSEALGAPRTNFRRMVVVNLVGGCDTLNMVIPAGLSSYYSARGTLAIPSSASLALNGTTAYKLHPAMSRIQGLWNSGDALAVQRVGYPRENLSHFESSDILSYGVRNGFTSLKVNKSGWVARYADLYAATPLGAVSIGMGRPLDFVGGVTHGLAVNSLAGFQISGAGANPNRIETAKSIIKNAPTSGLATEAKDALAAAYDLAVQVQQALADHDTYVASAGLTWPNNTIANRLRDVAALIHGGFDTRVFYTGYGEFDTHSTQTTVLGSLLAQLDAALGAFSDEMKALQVWDDIVVVVITEFGRRSYSYGGGTDHGHGFAEMLVGGAVNGGASYGPDLTNGDLTNSTGYLSYAVDFRSIYKEVIRDHLGADPAPVFPESLQIENSLNLV